VSENVRVLVTGFGPFPGAPFNPTITLVRRLTQLRRPALDDIELTGHIFHVAYQTIDDELPGLIERLRPRVLLMFGLADRTAYLRVETSARNAVSRRLDADGKLSRKGSIVSDGPDALFFGPHTAKLVRAALATGIDARPSGNAGSYLCNYLSWRAIEATARLGGPRLASFIHVPLIACNGLSRVGPSGMTLDQLVDAGEAMLLEMAQAVREAKSAARLSGSIKAARSSPI
jgi:pyroglutamyl-peptidase